MIIIKIKCPERTSAGVCDLLATEVLVEPVENKSHIILSFNKIAVCKLDACVL